MADPCYSSHSTTQKQQYAHWNSLASAFERDSDQNRDCSFPRQKAQAGKADTEGISSQQQPHMPSQDSIPVTAAASATSIAMTEEYTQLYTELSHPHLAQTFSCWQGVTSQVSEPLPRLDFLSVKMQAFEAFQSRLLKIAHFTHLHDLWLLLT